MTRGEKRRRIAVRMEDPKEPGGFPWVAGDSNPEPAD